MRGEREVAGKAKGRGRGDPGSQQPRGPRDGGRSAPGPGAARASQPSTARDGSSPANQGLRLQSRRHRLGATLLIPQGHQGRQGHQGHQSGDFLLCGLSCCHLASLSLSFRGRWELCLSHILLLHTPSAPSLGTLQGSRPSD